MLRELTRIVSNDCAVEIDTNSYSVPWRLIGERVAVTVAAGEIRIRHGVRQVAVHKQSAGAVVGSSTLPTSTELRVAMARFAGPRQLPCRRRHHRPHCCVPLPNTRQ